MRKIYESPQTAIVSVRHEVLMLGASVQNGNPDEGTNETEGYVEAGPDEENGDFAKEHRGVFFADENWGNVWK